MLDFAVQIAREAGAILAEKYERKIEISYKGAINPVTEVDFASERHIIERIRSRYPRHAILAEESGAAHIEAGSEWRWVIDPLDGTTNYSHGYPCFCVSIGLERIGGEPEIGVVFDPLRDELFAAERGAGATLNGKPIRVSTVDTINRAMLVTGFPYDVQSRPELLKSLFDFLLTAQAVRRDGSAALDLAYVACGRFEGFWEDGLQPWDTAAGTVLIREAGGIVTHYDGSPYDIHNHRIVASNGVVHSEMLKVLQQ